MDDESPCDKFFWFFGGMVIMGLITMLVVGGTSDAQIDAVARGCAEWRVDKDKVVTFHWLCGEDAKP